VKKIINETKELIDDILNTGKQNLYEYSREQVLKNLEESGLSESDFSEDELNMMISEEYRKNESFGKGAAAGAGILMFLGLIG